MAKNWLRILLGAALTVSGLRVAATAQPVEELRRRFEQGRALYSAGEYARALALFEQNLAADPASKGSLLFSALAHIQAGDFIRADGYLDRFLALEPADSEGLIAAVKTKQALNKSGEVEELRRRLFAKRAAGGDPRLKVMMSYEREVIYRSDGSRISILENFEPDGSYGWLYLLLDKDRKTIKRRLEMAAVPTSTRTCVLGETLRNEAGISGYKIYHHYATSPKYEQARRDALTVMAD
jgi:tetratricopeptide (TPR) repeat protein